MSRISIICVLSGTLAVLAFSANVASAGSVTVHTTVPNVKVQAPTNPKPTPYLKYELKDVYVTGHSLSGSNDNAQTDNGKVTLSPGQVNKQTDKSSAVLYDKKNNKNNGGDEKPKESISINYDDLAH
jgi:type VI protein secretion system component Hcp